MIYVTVLKEAFEYNGVEYWRGQNFYAQESPLLSEAKEKGIITYIPLRKKDDTETFRYIMYTGHKPACVLPSGGIQSVNNVAIRCTAYPMPESRAIEICENDDWQIVKIAADGTYVMPDATLPVFPIPFSDRSKPLKVLFIRDNGAGDVIMSMPTVGTVRELLPHAELTYATIPSLMHIASGTIDPETDDYLLDKVISVHDIDFDAVEYDIVINWCMAVENYDIDRNRGNRIESFAKQVGIELGSTKLYGFKFILGEITEAIASTFNCDKTIAYVLNAASWSRTYPIYRMAEMAEYMQERMPGYKLLIIGRDRGDIEGENIVDISGMTESFLDGVAIAATCRAIISPDTGIVHAIQTLPNPRPCVVLCGDIPGEVRYGDYKNVTYMNPSDEIECWPCWCWQERRKDGSRKTCYRTKENICMDSHDPKEIVDTVAEVLGL